MEHRGQNHRGRTGHDPTGPRPQDIRRRRRRRRSRSHDRRRRVLLAARTVGIGQDHRAADDRRIREADCRCDPARRPGGDVAGAVRPRRQHGLPGLRAVPAHDGAAERRVRAQGQGRRSIEPPRSGRSDARDHATVRTTARGDPTSCPAGSASGWRSPERSSTSRGCCCSTSHSARSTSSSARRCRSS